MLIYSLSITHRLKYISDFIGKELCGRPFQLTDNRVEYENWPDLKINYTPEPIAGDQCWIKPHPILFENGIHEQEIDCFESNRVTAFFKSEGDFPFDIFAAAFYLLSRYEEYLPHQKDMYGRYAHGNSLAFRQQFLDTPLVNSWLTEFGKKLQEKFPAFLLHHSPFTFIPTYDIDEAYSFKHKDWWRSAGAAVKDILRGKWKRFSLRRAVLNNQTPDPFDSYDWIDNLHRPYKCKPRYFFLVPEKAGKYDRNNLPSEMAMQVLIRQHADKYSIGVHPSWQSGDDTALMRKEIRTIEHITKLKVMASRQHFIRLSLPETYRRLVEAGIKEDFSMGYGSINGFRASVASPFYWYDLEKDEATCLLLYPFCYMEANSFYEQQLTPEQAFKEMQHYYEEIKKVNGTLITIWHNTFLGTDEKFKGWREVYSKFFHQAMDESKTIKSA
ncbi:MAG: polysaccharide deacetylase family protein [Chitinophagaceae bacterium]|nr:polysaccharide deacetylase family protein [Chitinophagaceae bacterium]